MKVLALNVIGLLPVTALPQHVDWNRVDLKHLLGSSEPAKLTDQQQEEFLHLINSDGDGCPDDPEGIGRLKFSVARVGAPHVVYVVPGQGCLRGGQGSNASLWLVDVSGSPVRIIASPSSGFEGWGLGIQKALSHGLHDVVIAWHMSAFETIYTYLRFDGHSYREVDKKTIIYHQ